MTGFLIFLGITSYILSILFFALKPIRKKLLNIKIVIFHIYTLGSIIGNIMTDFRNMCYNDHTQLK
jgi:predicted membrane channel-forming protein YqfA (hemolysin III family)